MLSFLSWYLLISLVGVLALPLAYRMLSSLPDRGYALARPLGLLIWGFAFWLLASLHILQNDAGGVLLALFILAGLSAWSLGGGRWRQMMAWLKSNRRLLISGEVVFFVLFAAWAFVRACNPEILGTEKPMEMAFINAILHSPAFPPHDPWLSGYAISYYYFGYVMVAMLTRLTGVAGPVAFNLAVALWFALTGLAAYGVVYNLVCLWRERIKQKAPPPKTRKEKQATTPSPLVGGILGPFFVLILSNIEGFLEMIHARGWFWSQDATGTWLSGFWRWLNVLELSNPPSPPFGWLPERVSGIWWWRASRVLQDFDLLNQSKEIIDEFPFFSYLLGDLHPHVLAMPFAILAVSLALNLYIKGWHEDEPTLGFFAWINRWWMGDHPGWNQLNMWRWMRRMDFWLAALALGGLAFLNTWDFPIYVALFSAAYVLAEYERSGWHARFFRDFIGLGFLLGVLGVLLYLPFYIGFASQAGGILPSLSFFTRGVNFWVMFSTLLLPILAWLIHLWRVKGSKKLLGTGFKFALSVVGGLWLASYILAALLVLLPVLAKTILVSPGGGGWLYQVASSINSLGDLFFGLHGSSRPADLLLETLLRRLVSPGTWLTLLGVLMLAWGLLGRKRSVHTDAPGAGTDRQASPNTFVLLLVLVGIGLTLAPEFIYLRDQFGWRMNTIFKFYFQTWILWGLAAAYASTMLLSQVRSAWRHVYRVSWIILMLLGLMYPLFGIISKTDGFTPPVLTLDGSMHLKRYNPDEMAAIQWLQDQPQGVVAEAVGGSYSGFGRVSTYSGMPTVLGWPGHESQWRGGSAEMGSRETDMARLYRTSDWQEAAAIVARYGIQYVFVGSLEMTAYRANTQKFQMFLKPVFQQGDVIIFAAP